VPAKLTIVIPALNEEQSIAAIVERCLAAAPTIRAECGVDEVEIVVVSDGSTDRTAEIARGFEPRIRLVVFPRNRGYGAAIKEGWRVGGGDLLAFLDADGTCDPLHFVPMCRKSLEGFDVVLGNRLHAGSRMPAVRRFGNRLFALLLGYLSQKKVGDTASGMRVIRREALRYLYPLPDGMHFTPAISAVSLVHEDLRIAEIEMPYEEREGRSKLRLFRDGLRFLGAIFAAVVLFRPRRLTLPAMAALVVAAAAFAAGPVSLYARERRIDETGHVHQLLFTTLLAALAAMLFCATYVAEHVIAAGHLRLDRYEAGRDRLVARTTFRALLVLSGAACIAAILFASGLLDRGRLDFTATHWSRFVLALLATVVFGELLVTALLIRFVRGLDRKLRAFHEGADATSERAASP
jgi:hypothetical protein